MDSNDKSELAAQAAKMIADETMLSITTTLKKFNIKDGGLFQGQVCDILSSFILSIMIKVLQMNKIPKETIDQLCELNTERGFNMARMGKFSYQKDH